MGGTPIVTAALVGVGCSSAAVLILEVVLTRVFAVAQFYHFAFLAVSLALLGYGASGSVLAVWPRLGHGGPRRWAVLAAAQSVATIGAYATTNIIPFDSFSLAWDRTQIAYLMVYLFVLAIPFFFGGTVIGALLAGWDQPVPIPSHHIYAASLAGSGVGALLAVAALGQVGGEGVVALAALVALTGALAFDLAVRPRSPGWLGVGVGAAILLGVIIAQPPDVLALRLSPYKDLSAALRYPDAEIVSTHWSAAGRVDHVESEGIRSLPGLSFTYPGAPPPQDAVTIDGDDLNAIPRVAPADADFVSYLLGSLAFSMRPGGDALILEPRGGLDVLVALHEGARSVTAVEPNRGVVEAVRATAPNPYEDGRVEVVVEEPRSYVERTERSFDIIDLALTSTYRPVTSGAYSLAEEYLLTTTAFERYLDRLGPGGILTAVRWLQTPPSEETRLLALAADAARRSGADPEQSIVAMRGYATALVMLKPDGFDAAELAHIRAFADELRFDLIAGPGVSAAETNRYNRLPEDVYHPLAAALLMAPDPGPIYTDTQFDITPPSDDHPFFGHFFRWSQTGDVLDSIGRTWQPFGGAGYFVLVVLLGFAVLGGSVLIVAPLALTRGWRGAAPGRMLWWTVAYFGLLGIAFLFVEIPLAQRYILLIGRPTTALATVLFALLVASGVGSLVSARVPWRLAAGALATTALALPFAVGPLTTLILPAPIMARIVLGSMVLAPLGFLMGVMFPKGLAHLESRAPELVPWAWGINGVASVISAVGSALLALSFGFRFVVVVGAACYGVTVLLARPSPPGGPIASRAHPPPVKGTKTTGPRLSANSSPDSSLENIQSV
jgi:hypothetical protein